MTAEISRFNEQPGDFQFRAVGVLNFPGSATLFRSFGEKKKYDTHDKIAIQKIYIESQRQWQCF